jgi:hypothetical protein
MATELVEVLVLDEVELLLTTLGIDPKPIEPEQCIISVRVPPPQYPLPNAPVLST